jgi:glycosyltransferase involved in cell wall biosynthesis
MPLNYLTESGFLVGQAVRRANGVYCPAHFLKPKIKQMYRLAEMPGLLPNLIDLPEPLPQKSKRPTFTFIARFDRRKRAELFFDLAGMFPEYQFIAVGKGTASAEAGYDRQLRTQGREIKNLELPGLIDRFQSPERMHRILANTWVLVSTAAREGLPLTFLEAAAYGCAILSAVDPDQFATRFGKRVEADDFGSALPALLAEAPLEKGRAARDYVKQVYETSVALTVHIEQYQQYVG